MIIENKRFKELLTLNNNYSACVQHIDNTESIKSLYDIASKDILSELLIRLTDIQTEIRNILNNILINRVLEIQIIKEDGSIVDKSILWDDKIMWDLDIVVDKIYICTTINKEYHRINLDLINIYHTVV